MFVFNFILEWNVCTGGGDGNGSGSNSSNNANGNGNSSNSNNNLNINSNSNNNSNNTNNHGNDDSTSNDTYNTFHSIPSNIQNNDYLNLFGGSNAAAAVQPIALSSTNQSNSCDSRK